MKTIWFTGLPCSGKTTLADALAERLRASTPIPGSEFKAIVRLDGDHVREGLSEGLGWTAEGRSENIRRCAEVAHLLNDQDIMVIASFITPLEHHRRILERIIHKPIIVHVDTPVEVCKARDVKGMWDRAARGLIRGFTGHDSCYEEPWEPAMVIDTSKTVECCVSEIIDTCLLKETT